MRPNVAPMKSARYIMIGGFLGAGKTTSVMKLAQFLTARGVKVGLITNDQGVDMVDTAMLRSQGFPTEEIPGGCFCCRFNSLIDAAGTNSVALGSGGLECALPTSPGNRYRLTYSVRGPADFSVRGAEAETEVLHLTSYGSPVRSFQAFCWSALRRSRAFFKASRHTASRCCSVSGGLTRTLC